MPIRFIKVFVINMFEFAHYHRPYRFIYSNIGMITSTVTLAKKADVEDEDWGIVSSPR